MKEEILELYEDKLVQELNNLDRTEVGSKDRSEQINQITKMYAILVDEAKVDADYSKEVELKTRELDIREKELESEEKSKKVEHVLTVASICLPLVTYTTLFCKGLKFEETGSMASSMMKNLLTKLRFGK